MDNWGCQHNWVQTFSRGCQQLFVCEGFFFCPVLETSSSHPITFWESCRESPAMFSNGLSLTFSRVEAQWLPKGKPSKKKQYCKLNESDPCRGSRHNMAVPCELTCGCFLHWYLRQFPSCLTLNQMTPEDGSCCSMWLPVLHLATC